MIAIGDNLCSAAVLAGVIGMSASLAAADVTFAPLSVVGWDAATRQPIWVEGHSGDAHTDMGGMYKPATKTDMARLDKTIFEAAVAAGYQSEMPASAAEFHARSMTYRCTKWSLAQMPRPALCEDVKIDDSLRLPAQLTEDTQ